MARIKHLRLLGLSIYLRSGQIYSLRNSFQIRINESRWTIDEEFKFWSKQDLQRTVSGQVNDLADRLYWWVDYFNITFFKDQPVPVPVISFEKTNIDNLGRYVIGKNAIGVKENININNAYLKRPLWEILATLLHELTHSWQASYGKPSNNWYHNNELRSKIRGFGIFTNEKGCLIKVGDPFVALLKGQGIEFKENPN